MTVKEKIEEIESMEKELFVTYRKLSFKGQCRLVGIAQGILGRESIEPSILSFDDFKGKLS